MDRLEVTFSNKLELICFHTVKWFQVWLFNAYNHIRYNSFISHNSMVSSIAIALSAASVEYTDCTSAEG